MELFFQIRIYYIAGAYSQGVAELSIYSTHFEYGPKDEVVNY
jgi:hypothetical protein